MGCELLSLYSNDNHSVSKNSLARWLVLELAPTILGNKPATVLSITDSRNRPLLTLWRQYAPELFNSSIVRCLVLKETDKRLAVLFYRPDMLEKCINEPSNQQFLEQHGYPVAGGIEACLTYLKDRFAHTCPHDMGVLLGIPLKDVLGFMGLSDQPLCCRGCWHVYGNPECSLAVMKRFDDDKQLVAAWLDQGWLPCQVLSYQQSA